MMKFQYKAIVPVLTIATILVCGICYGREKRRDSRQEESNSFSMHTPKRSIYYWKTVFRLDDEERAFLDDHGIGRLYLRYFDVSYEPAGGDETIIPNATIRFESAVPDSLEVVPTIFITNEAMCNWYYDETLADQVIYRIEAINLRNHIPQIHEVQVDCDWTERSEPRFFDFCRQLRERLHRKGIALSSTIRLHQLREEAPPVDRGVLMCYNTGALRKLSTENSILSSHDVYTYLKRANWQEFQLPLDIAYPTFGWSVMYDPEGRFKGLVRTTELSDTTVFRPLDGNRYEARHNTAVANVAIPKGNILRLEQSDILTVLSVKQQLALLLKEHLPLDTSVILYHLDSNNLSHYSHDEIEDLYR